MKKISANPESESAKNASDALRLLIEGFPKKANIAFKRKIAELRKILADSKEGHVTLFRLSQHKDAAVRVSAATYLLPINEKHALETLREVEKGNYPWQLQSNAKIIEDQWKSGSLDLYWFNDSAEDIDVKKN